MNKQMERIERVETFGAEKMGQGRNTHGCYIGSVACALTALGWPGTAGRAGARL